VLNSNPTRSAKSNDSPLCAAVGELAQLFVPFVLLICASSSAVAQTTNIDVVTREVSVFNLGQSATYVDVVTREVSVFNLGQSSPFADVTSREVSVYNFGQSATALDVVTREISVFNSGTNPPPIAFPDLTVSISNAPPATLAGSNVVLVYKVSNIGTTNAVAPWTDEFLLATDSAGDGAQVLGTSSFTNSLALGQSATVSQTLTLPTNLLGTYYLGVFVNGFSNIVESSMSNNTAFVPLTIVSAPMITAQPQNVAVPVGTTTSFTVAAGGTVPLSFHWQFDGTNLANGPRITGSQSSALTITGTLTNDSGLYTAVVSNSYGSVTSSAASLAVYTPSSNSPLTVTTFAGLANNSGTNDGTGSSARFSSPLGVAVDLAGNIYVADDTNSTIRKITPAALVTTLAGSAGNPGHRDAPGSSAQFQNPTGVAVDTNGNVYVTENVQNLSDVRKITPGGVVSTFATGMAEFLYGIAADGAGNLYVSGQGTGVGIYKITPAGAVSQLTTGVTAPTGVAVDGMGNVVVAENGTASDILMISPSGTVTVISGGAAGFADGAGSAAQFNAPWGVALDPAGNLYVADDGNNSIRKLTPMPAAGGTGTFWLASTVAGQPTTPLGDGVGAQAGFSAPTGIAVDTNGNIYVADANSDDIRKGGYSPSFLAQPETLIVALGSNLDLTAPVSGTLPLSFGWTLNGVSAPGGTNSTLLLPGLQYNDSGTYSVAVSNAYGATTSAVAYVTVMAAPAITAQPLNSLAAPGQNAALNVTASGDGTLAYQWSRNGLALGAASLSTLNLTGVTAGQAGTYTVTVSNLAGSVTSAPALLTVAGTAVTSGNVNGTWTAANSPYVMAGNFSVNNLTMQPGSTLWVNGAYALIVTGSLTVNGTSSQPVTFNGSGWEGLRYASAGAANSMSWAIVRGATGGGIRLTNTPFAMTNCVVDSNSGVRGGGIYTDSALWMQNCSIVNNSATFLQQGSNYVVQGGGIFVTNGPVTLVSCVISNNTAVMPGIGTAAETSTGGGIDCESGSLTLNQCVVISNVTAGAGPSSAALGGAVYASINNTSAVLSAAGCFFQGNQAAGGFGGAIAAGEMVLRTTALSNNAASFGGAIYAGGAGQLNATNCLFVRNSGALGGAFYSTAASGSGRMENCTVAYNSQDGLNGFGGALHNCVLYFDGPNEEIVLGAEGLLPATYCDIAGSNYAGAGNISADPLFADTHDFLLSETSPCLDAGDPAPQFNNEAFPPSQIFGGDQNEAGAYGGPGAAFWPQFALSVPIVVVNGQPTAPYQELMFVNTTVPTITITNGISGGVIGYSLDGSDPVGNINYSGPFNLSATAVIRAVAYNSAKDYYEISAPVFVNLAPAFPIAAGTTGGGSVSPAFETVGSNSMVTFAATPDSGWQFLYWTNGVTGTNSSVSVSVSGPMTNVQAVFGTPLTVSRLPLTSGTVATNPQLALYPYGSQAQLIAEPVGNHYFTNWIINATDNSEENPLDFVVTNATPTIVAVFASEPASFFAVNLIVAGDGNVSRAPDEDIYASGSTVAITATPSAGYRFAGWTGGAMSTNNPLDVTVNSNLTITANFVSTNAIYGAPLVAITNPASGASFLLPANVAIQAAASDTNSGGRVAQVLFYSGTNELAVVTNSPFAYTWTNPPAGANILSAVAVNAFGLTATSTPVSITVSLPPPGPPVFSCGQAAYSVFENAGNVTITVQNSPNSLAGVVNYATANGSALALNFQGVGNYQAVSGSLNFAAGQTFQTVTIPITDNLVYEGNTFFTFSLTPSGDGSSVGFQETATVTIIDVNPPSTTNTVLASIFPTSAPPSTGRLEVITQPPGAQGQWKLTWEKAWHDSGDVISGLPTGNYPVQFGPSSGFAPPTDTTNPVFSGSLTLVTNNYTPNGTPTYGLLTVTLYPATIATGQGAWQLQGETNWHASGATVANVLTGTHIIEFQFVPNWDLPEPLVVNVNPNQVNAYTATYLVSDQIGSTVPSVLQFNAATIPEFGLPYAYNGQLLTSVGYGSGCVVQRQVVLTAAHLVFDDVNLADVNGVDWFFQEYSGIYDPPAQTPAGWYVYGGYAAARENDLSGGLSPGEESPASQDRDVAALYFLSDAGRGGSSGYLVSEPGGTQWLQAAALKTLVGYPVDSVAQIDVGRMHSTTSDDYQFSPVTNEVFTTSDIVGYGGESGGPLCVYVGGTYYPAGIYLGGTKNTIVRAIDGNVAQLINDAKLSAATGANHGGNGGVPGGPINGRALGVGTYQIKLGPPAALAAGGGWQVLGQTASYQTNTGMASIPEGAYTAYFRDAAGFINPGSLSLTVAAGQNTVLTVNYASSSTGQALSLSAPAYVNHIFSLTVAGSAGENFAIERSTNLIHWVALSTNSLPSSGSTNFTDAASTNSPTTFYRARAVP
jgi:uncharacterized repeat protein (TIGR02543 family)